MKRLYPKWLMSLVLLIVGITQSSAQIVLHEATDIIQTKATLSADFPESSTEHGFQYKYGTLPEIDEFSKFALSELSDPVQLETNTSTGWTVHSTKGWIESKTTIPVGQSSSITANVTLYEDSDISFDWAVDSEDNVGILSFNVDGVELSSISGLVEFATISFSIPKGEHTFTWKYVKKSETNIGLDLARLRNIFIPNTTPGEWIRIDTSTSSAVINTLYPDKSYIFRAFAMDIDRNLFSPLNTFATPSFNQDFFNITINPVTQTTALVTTSFNYGENNVYPTVEVSTYRDGNFSVGGVFGDYVFKYTETPLLRGSFRGSLRGNKSEDGIYAYSDFDSNITGYLIGWDIKINEPFRIKFTWGAQGVSGKKAKIMFSIDGEVVGSCEAYSNDLNLSTFEYIIEPGNHSLSWNCDGQKGQFVRFGECILERESSWNRIYNDSEIQSGIYLSDLLPDHKYQIRANIHPNYSSPLDKTWKGTSSDWKYFNTHNITVGAPLSTNITQGSISVKAEIDRGDSELLNMGLQYKISSASSWIDYPVSTDNKLMSHIINRLRPNTKYDFRAYATPIGCDTVFSKECQYTTLQVVANKPIITKLSQHEVILTGKITYGDASIYARGMQFRKKGITAWEEVEDGGNDSIYTLVKKNLEMGATYQARTYVQPAGCDILYSDILEFTTLDTYFTKCNSNDRTQTTITLVATLADVDEGVTVDSYGFEYFINSDGFFENANTFVKSDVFDVPITPNGKELKTVITGLAPYMGIRWRAYAKINGEKTYFTSYKNWEWDFAGTDRATIVATVKNITQTSICLELDATQEGDAVVSQIEYALANSVQDTHSYSICGNTLTLENLIPNKQYNVRFRGLVNNRYCPLLKELSWDYSWFEYKTLPINVNVSFSDVTQTKAKMEVVFDSGDADVSDIRYRLNYSDILPYTNNQLLNNLAPGSTYSITIYAKVNGEEMSWTRDASDNTFSFTTKSVSANVSIPETYQTAAKISWAVYVGDATFVGFGLEIGDKEVNSDSESGEQTFNELIPNSSYTCRSYVETVEGGRVYSTQKSFKTKAISTTTLNVSNISNRSATMNGEIDCDSYSSAEFGFQWKQMEGWQSAPAFTKGVKREDGEIAVSLVNGMLEPNTDYQYRTAVRYLDEIYTSNDWKTFRTESEFIYYPATVYTVFRTDRENNALILCGYYIAGSETITSQGYEYWQVGQQSSRAYAPQNAVTITTDESMQHTFLNGELANGNYAVRAFVRTETGDVLYGATLGFNVSENGYSGIDTIDSDNVRVFAEGSTLKVVNGNNLSCYIYDLRGLLITKRDDMSEYEEFHLAKNAIYIVKLSNGKVMKLRL